MKIIITKPKSKAESIKPVFMPSTYETPKTNYSERLDQLDLIVSNLDDRIHELEKENARLRQLVSQIQTISSYNYFNGGRH